MIRIGILGDIGSGKTYVAKSFGYPVFNADYEVGRLYKKDKATYKRLKKNLPKYFSSFPINKNEVLSAILDKKVNLKKIVKIVHAKIREKLNYFLIKNKKKRIVILDIPLFLENKLNKKKDILVFVQSKRSNIIKKLKKRKNYNKEIIYEFKKIQLPLSYKKKKARFIIKNDFKRKSVKNGVKRILKEILL